MAERKKAAKVKKAAPKARSRKPRKVTEGAPPPESRTRRTKAAKSRAAVRVASAADEFRTKSADELSHALGTLRKEQFNLRFQRANGQLEKTNRVRVVRRNIARIQTIQNERRRAEGM